MLFPRYWKLWTASNVLFLIRKSPAFLLCSWVDVTIYLVFSSFISIPSLLVSFSKSRYLAPVQYLHLLAHIRAVSDAHATSYSIRTAESFLSCNGAEVWIWPLTPSSSRVHWSYPPLLHMPPWSAQDQLYLNTAYYRHVATVHRVSSYYDWGGGMYTLSGKSSHHLRRSE